jgi:hypothetical protein
MILITPLSDGSTKLLPKLNYLASSYSVFKCEA